MPGPKQKEEELLCNDTSYFISAALYANKSSNFNIGSIPHPPKHGYHSYSLKYLESECIKSQCHTSNYFHLML